MSLEKRGIKKSTNLFKVDRVGVSSLGLHKLSVEGGKDGRRGNERDRELKVEFNGKEFMEISFFEEFVSV